jgi:hypothetical protein
MEMPRIFIREDAADLKDGRELNLNVRFIQLKKHFTNANAKCLTGIFIYRGN